MQVHVNKNWKALSILFLLQGDFNWSTDVMLVWLKFNCRIRRWDKKKYQMGFSRWSNVFLLWPTMATMWQINCYIKGKHHRQAETSSMTIPHHQSPKSLLEDRLVIIWRISPFATFLCILTCGCTVIKQYRCVTFYLNRFSVYTWNRPLTVWLILIDLSLSPYRILYEYLSLQLIKLLHNFRYLDI